MSDRAPAQPSLFDTGEETADGRAREAIRNRLDTTLFVEAGAGSGKTTALIGRILALVEAGIPMGRIVAITFTERAAADLRHRLRKSLRARDVESPDSDEVWAAALDELDGAAVGTLHAFAQRLLGEHPIEAGLPPNVEILDEISSQVEFDERWSATLDRLYADPDLTSTLELASALRIKTEHLRAVALEFARNWDLVASRPPGSDADPPAVDARTIVDELGVLTAFRPHCLADEDTMATRLDEIIAWSARLGAVTDDVSMVELLDGKRRPSFKAGNLGRAANWPDGVVAELRGRLAELEQVIERVLEPVSEACLQRLVHHIGAFVVDDAERRRVEGRLQFHDLLVHSRRLLADPLHGPSVRRALSIRYRRLLLDEFQDTDPLQIEVATLLAADPDAPAGPWDSMDTRAGRLFFVGDPKQSIYRFRRADIALYLAAQEQHRSGAPTELSRNFRSTAPILDWVNHTFGGLIKKAPGSQPEYRPLDADRPAPPSGPGVLLLDGEHVGLKAAELRTEEAISVAAAVHRCLDEGWAVHDEDVGWRAAEPRDICILVPARTSLPQLEAALTRADVPHRVETSTLLYAAEDVRTLMACLRTLADASDSLSLATALRSAAFGCGDDDLYTWSVDHGGRWDYRAPVPAAAPPDHPVAAAMTYLRGLAEEARWLTPPQVIDRVVHDRRLLESAAFAAHASDRWRHLRFVIDQARAWADAHGGDLRDYLAWARLQSSDTARVAEPVLDESDTTAVRVMTIHASKGLEFPITVLSGLTTRGPGRRAGPGVLFPPDQPATVKLTSGVAARDFEVFQPIDEQMDEHERIRLLYVGCTRARDHLVVSCHRTDRATRSAAEMLWAHGADVESSVVEQIRDVGPGPGSAEEEDLTAPLRPGVTPADDGMALTETRAEFETHRAAMIDRAADPSSLSATAVARRFERSTAVPGANPGLLKDAVDLDLPPWRRGRDGAAIGRAVHACLQDIDLTEGKDLFLLAGRHAAAEGIPDLERQIAALARAALGAPCVREAVAGPHWREIYVAAPAGSKLVEGYIDLLYRTAEGFVIVDYKTDAAPTADDRRDRAAVYRHQLATYALAIESTTGIPVVRCVLCFLETDGAHELAIDDLRAAMTEIGELAQRA